MTIYITKRQKSLPYRILSAFVAFTFVFSMVMPPQMASAQVIPAFLNLPLPGTMVPVSIGFMPTMVVGVTVHPENPLEFDFIVDKGDAGMDGTALEDESRRLIKYFLATLTTPEDELWVNLSPYEKDRMIPEKFGETEMGRDLLAQDYLLKQLTASLMYPEDELGKKFWDRVYKKAYDLYGTTEIPMNTFNKIWIIPENATVYQHENSAYVIGSHLKVMLEEDYVALSKNMGNERLGMKGVSEDKAEVISGVTSEVVREVLIPEIEKEVNEGATFANLRQIYNSMILATWYKKTLRDSLLGHVYVDQNKVKGVDAQDQQDKEKIYNQYLEAFQKGVYNYIKEDYDPVTDNIIPRKYFSGGTQGPRAIDTYIQFTDAISRMGVKELIAFARIKGQLTPSEAVLFRDRLNGLPENERWDVLRQLNLSFDQLDGRVTVKVALVENTGPDLRGITLRGQSSQVSSQSVTSSPISPLEDLWTGDGIMSEISAFLGPAENSLMPFVQMSQNADEASNVNSRDIETYEAEIKAVLNEANARRTLGHLPMVVNLKKLWLNNFVTMENRKKVINEMAEGKYFIEWIAGGVASRMSNTLKELGVNIHESELRIWNIKVWQIIEAIKRSKTLLSDPKKQALLEELQGLAIPKNRKDFTLGQWELYAISKSIDFMTKDQSLRDKIRENLTVVIHINPDIQENVERDLIHYNYFGLNHLNVILSDGGYGDAFIYENDRLKRIKAKDASWSHGFAMMELEWRKGYRLTSNGERVRMNEPVFGYLERKGVVYGLVRRVNDGFLLHPKNVAQDVDMFAALKKLENEHDADILFEAMRNPGGQKGGSPKQIRGRDMFGFYVETINAQHPVILRKFQELSKANEKGDPVTNRALMAFNLPKVREKLRAHGGFDITLKYDKFHDEEGNIRKGIIPEIPFGDLSSLEGFNAVIVQRPTDFFIEEGIFPSTEEYEKEPGALNRDFKEAKNIPLLAQIIRSLEEDPNLNPDEFSNGSASSPVENGMEGSTSIGLTKAEQTALANGELAIDQMQKILERLRKDLIKLEEERSQIAGDFITDINARRAGVERDIERVRRQVGELEAEINPDIEQVVAAARNAGFSEDENQPVSSPVGGIDLNPELLDLQIRRDSNWVPLPLSQQPIFNMKIEGFFPVIINITPIATSPLLLGLLDVEGPFDSADLDTSRVPDLGLVDKYRNKYIREESNV